MPKTKRDQNNQLAENTENKSEQKTINASSGSSAGALIPPDMGKLPRKDDKGSKGHRISPQDAGYMIDQVLRGAVETILGKLDDDPDVMINIDNREIDVDRADVDTVSVRPARPASPVRPVRPARPSSEPFAPHADDNQVPAYEVYEREEAEDEEDDPQYYASSAQSTGEPQTSTPTIPASQIVDVPIGEAVYQNIDMNSAFASMDEPIQSQDPNKRKAYEPIQVPKAVPNYRKPDHPTSKICSTCKFYQSEGPEYGYCQAFRFVAQGDYSCDAWEVVETPTNGVDTARNPVLNEEGDIIGSGLKAGDKVPDRAERSEVPKKYNGIDFTVTKEMAENARQALEVRSTKPESERGMTAVGIRRATQLANREAVSPDTWRRMNSYFDRHIKDKQGETWDEKGKGWQAWMGWGGDEARDKAKRVVEKMDEADEKDTAKSLGVPIKTVKEWDNQDCPSDIRDCELYKKVRKKIRARVTERGTQWGAYDSLALRREYKKELEADNQKSAMHGMLTAESLASAIEDEVLGQGGQVIRVKIANGIAGFDENLGTYTAKDLAQWLDNEWVNIREKNEDGSYAPCGERTAHGTVPKCLPKDRAEALTEDERQKLIRRKADDPDGTASNDTGDLREKGSDKSVDESTKVVNCDELSPSERKNYPECGEEYQSENITYNIGYHPQSSGGGANNNGDVNSNGDTSSGDGGSDSSSESSGSSGIESSSGDSGSTAGGSSGGTGSSGSSGGSSGGGAAVAAEDEVATKSYYPIHQASGPEHEVRGGEWIDGNLRPRSAESSSSYPYPERFARNVTPELSNDHGRRDHTAPFYLPGDRVYSTSMRSLGEVIKSHSDPNGMLYTIKLIDTKGSVHGQALVDQGDLSPRSMRAIKRIGFRSTQDDVRSLVQSVLNTVSGLVVQHQDYVTNPLDGDTLDTVEDMAKSVLSSPQFDDASSKMEMRKYVRAMQDVQHALGASIHLYHLSEETAEQMDMPDSASTVRMEAQSTILSRLLEAQSRLEEAMMDETPMRAIRPRR